MAIIDEYLTAMVEAGASDLHLSVNSPPKLRLSGRLDPIPGYPVIDQTMMFQTLREICRDIPWNKFMDKRDLDFAYEIEGVSRFRVNYFYNFWGQAGVLRVIPSKILTLEELNLPECLKKMADYNQGLVLVTGPTGSGKSSTMAAILDYINANRQKHIITIEDPIEFVHKSKRSIIVHREVGDHAISFPRAIKGAMRADPDVVLIGEMREAETIKLALSCASMGILVFGTLHTNNAPKTIDRIVDAFPPEEQGQVRTMLAGCLTSIVSQLLCKTVSGGRVATHEILFRHDALPNAILQNALSSIRNIIDGGRDEGMISMDSSLRANLQSGNISKETAYMMAADKNAFM